MYILSTHALGIVTYMYNIQEYLLIKNTSRANFLKFCDRQTILRIRILRCSDLLYSGTDLKQTLVFVKKYIPTL